MQWLPRKFAVLLCAMIAVAFLATPVFAEDEPDPPGRVARLKYMNGQVSFQPGGVNDWVDATLNRPLTTADRVWTDKDSKAELHLGTSALRMDSETSLTLTNLTDSTVQVELDQGVLNLHVRRMYPGEIYEVDTPNVAFTLLKPGDYRFEVNPDADTTEVIVRKGKGEGNGDGRGVEVESGEMARFEHGNTLMHSIGHAPNPDGFDDWCRVRDRREDNAESLRYVSDDVVGYEDLDDNGYWRPVPTYGSIWIPRHVVAGWAPYRYGHWAYIEPWGWTWIDDAPWGFAPFHYGRWVYSPYGWGWCPGPRIYRPVYAPALVAWIGGAHFGIGIGFGNVGWVPLGWGEPYYPYYRASRGYVRNVNISNTHITNITYVTNNYNNYINHRGKPVPLPTHGYMNARGVSVVPNDAMINSRRVDRHIQPWNGKDLNKAEMMGGPGVTPDRRSVLGAGNSARVPQGLSNRRPVVSKLTPPARPGDFDARRPYIEKNNGIPVDRNLGARGPRGPEERKPVAADEARGGNPGGGRANPSSPGNVRPPAERQPVRTDEGAARESGRHTVPRPPAERQPGNDGSPAARGPSNVGPSNDRQANDNKPHVVPRPPAERQPAGVNAESNRPGRDSKPNAGPRVPEERKPVTPAEDGARYNRAAPTNAQPEWNARPNAPQERRGAVNAETRPQSVPSQPVHEARPPAERQPAERHSAPAREAAPKQKPAERETKPTPATPTESMARSERTRNYVPRPSSSSASRYSAREYEYSSRSYPTSRESGYSSRSYPASRESGYSSRGYSNSRTEMRSAPVYRNSGYSGRSASSGYRQPSHAASSSGRSGGGSYSSSRSSGGSGRHGGR